jgi:hypothetical protein
MEHLEGKYLARENGKREDGNSSCPKRVDGTIEAGEVW